jgi:hypothetical protein
MVWVRCFGNFQINFILPKRKKVRVGAFITHHDTGLKITDFITELQKSKKNSKNVFFSKKIKVFFHPNSKILRDTFFKNGAG